MLLKKKGKNVNRVHIMNYQLCFLWLDSRLMEVFVVSGNLTSLIDSASQ